MENKLAVSGHVSRKREYMLLNRMISQKVCSLADFDLFFLRKIYLKFNIYVLLYIGYML